jgi:type VI secretion system FHA domain protein
LSESAGFIALKKLYPAGAPGSPDLVRFGPAGGVIGRGSQCGWVLDDPERVISKEHAKIVFHNGDFFVVGLGRNGVYMNGDATPLAGDVPTRLQAGDRLKLGRAEILVEEIVAPTRAAAPPGAAGPSVGPPAGLAPAADAERRLSEEWESRLGELLRTPASSTAPAASAPAPPEGVRAGSAANGMAQRPAGLGPLVDLPPPTVVLAPEQQACSEAPRAAAPASEPLTGWNRQGPLSSLLLGREALQPRDDAGAAARAGIPTAGPEPARAAPQAQPQPWPQPHQADPAAELPPLLLAGLPPLRMTDPPHADQSVPPLPPDAAFLRGIGIGLPQLSAAQAAVIAYDLGRALAALADLMVEVSHRHESASGGPPPGGPFAALPTGPLALSELVASPDYRPGQIERTVRDAIARARRLHGDAPDAFGMDVAMLAPAALMRRWNLDPRRRDSAARAWALFETHFPDLIATARNGHASKAELAHRLAPPPRTRAP